MSALELLIVTLLVAVFAPLAVGLLIGIDRKLTARMQNRVGPPVLQPYYDLIKLFAKERRAMNSSQTVFAIASMVLQMAAFVLLVTGGDLIVVFFVSSTGAFTFVLGAFSAHSPFSYYGAQRELLQILAYEPVIFMAIITIGTREHTFIAGGIAHNLFFLLPLSLLALLPVLVIKMDKSPYDIAQAHTEIVSGPYVEYSGTYLAIVQISHWFDLAILFGIMTIFFRDANVLVSIGGKLLIILAFFFAALIIDNTTARLTRNRMVKFTLAFGLTLTAGNMVILFLADQGVLRWP